MKDWPSVALQKRADAAWNRLTDDERAAIERRFSQADERVLAASPTPQPEDAPRQSKRINLNPEPLAVVAGEPSAARILSDPRARAPKCRGCGNIKAFCECDVFDPAVPVEPPKERQ